MTEQEAFEAWWKSEEYRAKYPDDHPVKRSGREGFDAALAWLRSQGEPVAWMNAKKDMTYFGHYNPDDVPLFLAPEPAIPDGWQSVAARDVLAERRRQVEAEGWTPKHDDRHGDRSLVLAAACYAKQYVGRAWLVESLSDGEERYKCDRVPDNWPDSWAEEWWKPKDPRRDLVRAAALILAEIERLDRRMLVTAPEPSK